MGIFMNAVDIGNNALRFVMERYQAVLTLAEGYLNID